MSQTESPEDLHKGCETYAEGEGFCFMSKKSNLLGTNTKEWELPKWEENITSEE
jgi:hypothetical protein